MVKCQECRGNADYPITEKDRQDVKLCLKIAYATKKSLEEELQANKWNIELYEKMLFKNEN